MAGQTPTEDSTASGQPLHCYLTRTVPDLGSNDHLPPVETSNTMPGLLHTEAPTRGRVYAAVAAEFVCTLLFAFFGGAAPGLVAAPANGIALAVLGEYLVVTFKSW